MKQKHIPPIITVFVCISLILAGCIKSSEYLGRLDDIGKSCKLKTFMFYSNPAFRDTAVFHYNYLGDPDSTTFPQRTPHSNFYFTYDNHHRLVDFIDAYPGRATGIFWTRYFYASEKSLQPSTDSEYVYPTDFRHWPPPGPIRIEWHNFEYDSLGRMVNDNGENFIYDAHGDLVLTGVQFDGPDNKVNFNRTSRVFQLIDRDYAVNNVFIASTYNKYGLPTDISLPFSGEGGEAFLGMPYGTAHIEYDCK